MDKIKAKRRHQIIVHGMWCITIFATASAIFGSYTLSSYLEYKRNQQDIEYSERAKKAIERQKEQQ